MKPNSTALAVSLLSSSREQKRAAHIRSPPFSYLWSIPSRPKRTFIKELRGTLKAPVPLFRNVERLG
jgi:hypothetical protein